MGVCCSSTSSISPDIELQSNEPSNGIIISKSEIIERNEIKLLRQISIEREDSIIYGPSKTKPTNINLLLNIHILNDYGEFIEFKHDNNIKSIDILTTQSDIYLEYDNNWINNIIPNIFNIKENKIEYFNNCLKVSPDLRLNLWLHVSGAHKLINNHPGFYNSLLLNQDELPRQIAVDIPRTHCEHLFFSNSCEGQTKLGRILHAVSLFLPRSGYVQGMNMIASLFLVIVNTEEEAFWLMVSFLDNYGMMDYYYDGLHHLTESMNKFKELFKMNLPVLFNHFTKEGVEPFCYITPWFLTIFTYNTSLEISAKIFDIFFLATPGDIFVFKFGLAYLQLYQDTLLKLTFNEIVQNLKELTVTNQNIIQLMELTQKIEIDIPLIEPQDWKSLQNFTNTQYLIN